MLCKKINRKSSIDVKTGSEKENQSFFTNRRNIALW